MKLKKILIICTLFILSSCSFEIKTQSNNNSLSSKYDTISTNTNTTDDNSNTSISSSNIISSSSEINSSLETLSTSEEKVNSPLKRLTILSINDLHGKIEQTNGVSGLSNIAYLINNVRSENPLDDVCLVGNGDMFQGQAISNLNYGLSVINAMNKMNFDMMGIGNHEFDWGIEKVLNYFDKNELNGEANFPLVNSNIVYRNDGSYLKHTAPYHIVYKEGLKIGFISAIGSDQYNSILKTKAELYEFKDMITYIGNSAEVLRKDHKCDIVICNIHDGGSYDIRVESANNKQIAALKGDKRIDALINGHTHQGYYGVINRDGVSLPVVQAYSSATSIGRIDLELDNNHIVSCSSSLIDNRYVEYYDKEVQTSIDNDYALLKDQIEEVYGISNQDINDTRDLYSWSISCMQKATDADVAFSNNGGLRGVNLTKGQEITLSDLYNINPFDNEIIIATVNGRSINNFINNYSSYNYYCIKDNVTIDNSKHYKVAVIDYLGFKNYFPLGNDYMNSHLIYRDIMIKDIKKRTELGYNFDPISDPNSYLSALI